MKAHATTWPILALLGLAPIGCTTAQQNTALATPTGQLFCAIHAAGGGVTTVALADATAAAATPAAAPLVLIATGATKAYVDAACAAAAQPGQTSVPVPPPAGPAVVPILSVTPPATK